MLDKVFDASATMSFKASIFIEKAKLHSSSPVKLVITLPSGEDFACNREFKKIPIVISGVELIADLKEFPMIEFEVILGMDWLAKYRAMIHCRDQVMTLRGPNGKRVSYSKVIVKKGVKVVSAIRLNLRSLGEVVFLCKVKGTVSETSLDDIAVVKEYADVFPEELPGIPLKRDVDLIIDLVPGTTPISKAVYRMALAGLQELNLSRRRMAT